MNATGAKWIAISVLGCVTFTLGMIPIKISSALRWTRHGCQRSPRSQLIISLLLCFGAGVLLATSLTHMLPEVRERVEEMLQQSNNLWPPLAAIPFTETLLALGFFLVYGLDELVHTILYRRQHSHHEHDSNNRGNNDPEESRTIHGHGHSHCPPASVTVREPRPSSKNSLLRQSAGQHHYGATECHGSHDVKNFESESSPLLITKDYSSSPLTVATGILALLALSIHSITEGLAIGLQASSSNVFFLLGAVATHKFVIAFCLGMELSSGWGVTRGISLKFHTVYMVVFSGMSALGILLGLLLMGTAPDGLIIQALQALSAGTLLYVTFCEILPRERAKCHAGLSQFLATLAGFVTLLLLDSLTPHK